jgi:NEDD4-binding protein 2
MNICKIMRGCSGSGKTTYIKNHFPKATVFSSDDFWMKDGKYCFDIKKLGEAHAWNLRRFINAVQMTDTDPSDRILVVDNTNTTIAEMAPYYAVASVYGFDTEIISLDVDEDVAHPRNQHNVPQATVHAQRRNFVAGTSQIPKYWKHKLVKPGEDGFCRA